MLHMNMQSDSKLHGNISGDVVGTINVNSGSYKHRSLSSLLFVWQPFGII